MDLGAALLALLTGLVVKLTVMGLAAWLLLRVYRVTYAEPRRLWRLLPDEGLGEVRVLWWALVLFAASELTCGIEVYVLFRSHPLLSGSHALTSAAGMALFTLGLYRHLDRVYLRYATRGCLLNRTCRGCTLLATGASEGEGGGGSAAGAHDQDLAQRGPASPRERAKRATEGGGVCRARSLALLAATFVALAAVPPLLAPTDEMVADPRRYVLPFESWNQWYEHVAVPWLRANVVDYDPSGVAYRMPSSVLVLELRVLPLVGLVLAGAAIARLRRGRGGEQVLCAAAGVLGYVYFELVLLSGTRDLLLASLGHEVGELWFLLAAAELLRFAYGAGAPGPAGEPAPAVAAGAGAGEA